MTSLTGDYAKCDLRCLTDEDCPLLYYCCPNGCGRVCVPPQVDVVDECGCSVTIAEPITQGVFDQRVRNLVWETLNESFSPALDTYIVDDYRFNYVFIGPMESQCTFRRAIEHYYPNDILYNAFKRPRRILIILSDSKNSYEDLTVAPLDVIYNTVCAVTIGNISIDDVLLKKLSVLDDGQSCLWSVDSVASLGEVIPNISSIVNDGGCRCGPEDEQNFSCKQEGEACTLDRECDQPSYVCVKGMCSPRNCKQQEKFDLEPLDYYYDYEYVLYDYDPKFFEESYYGFYEDYDYFYREDASENRMLGSSRRIKIRSEEMSPVERWHVSVPAELLTSKFTDCCSWNEFQCSGVPATCINGVNLCDGVIDCLHGDDETPEACAKRICGDRWFKCNSGQCIHKTLICNGIKNCPDGSDEMCLSQSDCPSLRPHFCSSGECIGFGKICDEYQDCKSGEDEIHCRCKGHRCSPVKCLEPSRVCNGQYDCLDGSDEHCSEKNASCPTMRPFKCSNGECLKENYVCNGCKDCIDGSDEDPASCSPESCYYCDSGQCILDTLVCDGLHNCDDHSDESNCKSFVCRENQFHCSSGECLEESVRCNGREECVDGSDELICDSCPDSRPLRCSSGECIAYTKVCNGIYDCDDRSDESKCLIMSCPVNRPLKCASGQCYCEKRSSGSRCLSSESYPYEYPFPYCLDGSEAPSDYESGCDDFRCKSGKCGVRCNGRRECEDGGDEEDCENMPCSDEFLWRCKSIECISVTLRCDGNIDCSDSSDEEGCLTYTCPQGYIKCISGECYPEDRECDGFLNCIDGSDEKYCLTSRCILSKEKCKSGECVYREEFCNGFPKCLDGSDEDSCLNYSCSSERSFHCKSGVCIKASQRCDGFLSCPDGSDEEDCQNYACPSYRPYSCPSGICITFYQLCNGVDDCGDGSDEMDCGNLKCPEKAFKCNKGNCIPPRYRCDEEEDCKDGEDEVNCENYQRQCDYKFPCIADNECIPTKRHCDGRKHCSDWADEKDCPPVG